MDKFYTYSGGMPNVNTADIWRMQYATYFGWLAMAQGLNKSSVDRQASVYNANISMAKTSTQITFTLNPGYVYVNGEISAVKSATSATISLPTSGYYYEWTDNKSVAPSLTEHTTSSANNYCDLFIYLTTSEVVDSLGTKTFGDSVSKDCWKTVTTAVNVATRLSSVPTGGWYVRYRYDIDNNTLTKLDDKRNFFDLIANSMALGNLGYAMTNFNKQRNSNFTCPTWHDIALLNSGWLTGVAELTGADGGISSDGHSITFTYAAILQGNDYTIFTPSSTDYSLVVDSIGWVNSAQSTNNYQNTDFINYVNLNSRNVEVQYDGTHTFTNTDKFLVSYKVSTFANNVLN